MAFVPFPRTVQVNVRYDQLGQDMENIFYFRKPLAEWTQNEAEVLAEDINTVLLADFLDCLNTSTTLNEIYIVDLSDANSWYIPFTTTGTGTVAQDPLPTSSACCITWQTQQRGRSYRGRSYIGGMPKSFLSNGLLTSGAITLYATFATNLLAIDGGVGAQMVVASRVQDGVQLEEGITTSIVSYRVNAVPADQRRRRIGVGS